MFGFKKPEYRRFDLKPQFWDPQKEAREEREKKARKELGLDENGNAYVPDVRDRFRNEYERRKASRRGNNTRYTMRLFMILIMLFLAAYLVMMKNPEGLMKFFGK